MLGAPGAGFPFLHLEGAALLAQLGVHRRDQIAGNVLGHLLDAGADGGAAVRQQFQQRGPLLDKGRLGRAGAGVGPSARAAPEGNHGHDHPMR